MFKIKLISLILNRPIFRGTYRSIAQTYADGRISSEDISSPDSLRIGVERDQLFHFNGKIDDVRIYKRALNNAEVAYLATH